MIIEDLRRLQEQKISCLVLKPVDFNKIKALLPWFLSYQPAKLCQFMSEDLGLREHHLNPLKTAHMSLM